MYSVRNEFEMKHFSAAKIPLNKALNLQWSSRQLKKIVWQSVK